MSISLQVAYPITDDTQFDHDYYLATHMALVDEHMGPHIDKTLVTKGLAGGPDVPPPFYAIASFVFADQAALDAAMAAAGPVLADIPKFTNSQPQMLIGQVLV
ncbi:MAG: EthD family reductase [Paracoccaceae bacterium]|nr:EthD family reductase [Paracoccaceae bacterium]